MKWFGCITSMLLLMVLFLTGCGSSGSTAGMSTTSTGAVALKTVWSGSTTTAVPPLVTTMSVQISGPGMGTMTRTFPAAKWQGTIAAVPVGTVTVTLTGLDSSGHNIYEGTVADQVVRPGQTTAVGTVVMQLTTFRSYTISGRVTSSGVGIPGVTVTLSGASPITVETDGNGEYTLVNILSGTYTVSAAKPGLTVSAPHQVTIGDANLTGIDFTAVEVPIATFTISGRVTVAGVGLAGVTIVATGSGTGVVKTDANGNFSFTGVSNGSYNISASLTGYTLSPNQAVVINSADVANMNFVAQQATAITLGSTAEDVITIQGPPSVIQNTGNLSMYYYGDDYYYISISTNKVTAWSNAKGHLRVEMVPGKNTTDAEKITLGSSMDDVVRIQKTPTVVRNYGTYMVFYYGSDSLNIATPANKIYTVTSWANGNKGLQVELKPGTSTTDATKTTLGTSLDDVVRLQGTPSEIRITSSSAIYFYGSDYYNIAVPSNTVDGWSNNYGGLMVQMVPNGETTTATEITLGSTVDDVVKIQGTPKVIKNSTTYATYYYGTDYLTIALPANRVTGWSNQKGTLLLHMIPGSNTTTASTITLGTTLDDVIKIQGTPKRILDNGSTASYYYGTDYITVSTLAKKVTAWYNVGGALYVHMVAGGNTTSATKIALGSTVDDVIKIQGTPTVIQNGANVVIYYYGRDYVSIEIPTNIVTAWSNTYGSLFL